MIFVSSSNLFLFKSVCFACEYTSEWAIDFVIGSCQFELFKPIQLYPQAENPTPAKIRVFEVLAFGPVV